MKALLAVLRDSGGGAGDLVASNPDPLAHCPIIESKSGYARRCVEGPIRCAEARDVPGVGGISGSTRATLIMWLTRLP